MNNKEFEKNKKELEQAKKQNNEIISISDERTRMSKVNSLEYKVGTTLVFSVMGYLLLFVTTTILTKSLGSSAITNIFPGFTYPIALIGGSLGIGTIAKTLFNKKFQTKERLKEFSTAKTKAEKLEEEIHYQIELEKAKNRNKAIDETIKVLNSNQTILSRISSRYDLNDRTAPQTKEEAEEKARELSTIIKEQYDKLDILTTQKVLHDRFWRIRQKFQRKTDIIMTSTISGLFSMFFTAFPILMLQDVMPSNSISGTLAVPFIPFIAGVVGGSAYMIKRNKDYKKVFNNLNIQLGENALEENLNKRFESAFEEQQEIEKLIETQIRDISLTEVQLQENRRYLDTFVTKEAHQKEILFQDYPALHITEETRRAVLEHPELNSGLSVRARMGLFYTDEEWEQRKEAVLNRPLPGEDNQKTTLVKKRKKKSRGKFQ